MTNDDTRGWYSVSVEYKPILSGLRSVSGDWYLQTTLVSRFIGRYTDRKNTSIDVDNIDSVELRQAFYAATDDALDALKLPRRSQKDYD